MSKNNIRIGSNNKIKDTNIATGDIKVKNSKENKTFLSIFLVPLIVTILGTVIATIIICYFNLK